MAYGDCHKLFLGTLETHFQEVISQDTSCDVIVCQDLRIVLQGVQHAEILRALTRKEKSNSAESSLHHHHLGLHAFFKHCLLPCRLLLLFWGCAHLAHFSRSPQQTAGGFPTLPPNLCPTCPGFPCTFHEHLHNIFPACINSRVHQGHGDMPR